MPLQVDHVFVCCDPEAPEAEALLKAGLVEGTRNVHPGQGTENRRFFFARGFLELFWVANADEAQSAPARRLGLWPRWLGRRSGACPFGIVFGPCGAGVEGPPFASWVYQPKYLPEGTRLLVADAMSLQEPALFSMEWAEAPGIVGSQPTEHAVPLSAMTSVSVGIPSTVTLSEGSRAAVAAGLLTFYDSPTYELAIQFDSPANARLDLRPDLPIILRGSPHRPADPLAGRERP